MSGQVIVVDDEAAIREAVQQWLELSGFDVRTCASAAEALALVDRDFPGIVVSDVRMPGSDGLQLLDKLLQIDSDLPVILVTGHGDVPMAVESMKKGALDFIQKPFKEDQLLELVERMLDKAKDAFATHQQAANRDALLSKLTGREAQVLERIVAGRLNKQIADDLGISIKTVEAHRANIMEKLGANTVADLLKIALGQNTVKI